MIKIGILVLTLALTACTRHIGADEELVKIAKGFCETANAELSVTTVRHLFPSFTVDVYILCKKEGSKDKIEIVLKGVK